MHAADAVYSAVTEEQGARLAAAAVERTSVLDGLAAERAEDGQAVDRARRKHVAAARILFGQELALLGAKQAELSKVVGVKWVRQRGSCEPAVHHVQTKAAKCVGMGGSDGPRRFAAAAARSPTCSAPSHSPRDHARTQAHEARMQPKQRALAKARARHQAVLQVRTRVERRLHRLGALLEERRQALAQLRQAGGEDLAEELGQAARRRAELSARLTRLRAAHEAAVVRLCRDRSARLFLCGDPNDRHGAPEPPVPA